MAYTLAGSLCFAVLDLWHVAKVYISCPKFVYISKQCCGKQPFELISCHEHLK